MNEENVNIKNMPLGKLYEFADRRYVWKIQRSHGTRGGNYLRVAEDPMVYTEVFGLGEDGKLWLDWSGRLIDNPGVYGENGLDKRGCFSIFSPDQDTTSTFGQEFEQLKPASPSLQQQVEDLETGVLSFIQQKLEEQRRRDEERY
jgi:hypothetical protein